MLNLRNTADKLDKYASKIDDLTLIFQNIYMQITAIYHGQIKKQQITSNPRASIDLNVANMNLLPQNLIVELVWSRHLWAKLTS